MITREVAGELLADGVRSVARTPDVARAAAVSYRYRKYTMIGHRSYVDNLMLAARWTPPGGEVVECGVWRGGMSRGLADMLGPGRKYHLFDSFEGLPPAQEIDGPAATVYQQRTDSPTYYDNCSADESVARRLFAGSNLDVEFHRGWFSDTVPKFEPERPISLLRLDGDWFESTLTCLRGLVPYLAPNALVLIDDYYSWEGCPKAVHTFLAETGSRMRIRSGRFGTCYLINEPVREAP
jgi:O-methyltransferase